MASSTMTVTQLNLLKHDDPPPSIAGCPANVSEVAKKFFASASSSDQILHSNLVSSVGVDVIEGGYNFVHILNLDTGESGRPLRFALRYPIKPSAISQWQTYTAVGCMTYCQQHVGLNIPTPAIYAYSCSQESQFIAMEYIDGDALSDVWLDLSVEERKNMVNQVAEIMRTMRTKTSFESIGGISPDGKLCRLVDGVDTTSGKALVDGLRLYNIGPYHSVREYVQSVFDRRYHHLDQMLHKDTLSNYRKEFRQEMRECLPNLTPEEAFKLVKSKRDDFMAQSYDWKYPFVLRHGDLHGRNVIVSRSSPRRILAIIDWDFGGSHALPFADRDFEVSSPCLSEKTDIRAEQAQEMYDAQLLIDELAGALPRDDQLSKLVVSMRLCVLNQEGTKKRHSTFRMFRNVVRDILAPIVGVLKCKACICN